MKYQHLALIWFLMATAAVSLRSAPIRDYPQRLVQPDGTVIHCLTSGDEFNHWLNDANHFAIVQDPATGYFVYAVQRQGRLSPSSHVVGRVDPAGAGLTPGLTPSVGAMTTGRDVPWRAEGRRSFGAAFMNNIVIFVRFADEGPEAFPDSIGLYDLAHNDATPGASSIYNYYREASYERLAVTSTFYPASADSVVSIQGEHVRNYIRPYNAVTNPVGYTNELEGYTRLQRMLAAAVRVVESEIPPDLSLDADRNGYVDNVCFILSGEVEGWGDVLWPHMSWLVLDTAAIHGTPVREYNVQFRGFFFGRGSFVGVLCHELFHSMGAPDLYHYSHDDLEPVGPWDLMSAQTEPPQHMGALLKHRYGGWIESIPTISTPGVYALRPLRSATGNCFKILSPYSWTEYFLLEYRRRSGTFESELPGEGLLVYRINATVEGNSEGPPDGVYIYRPGGAPGVAGDITGAAYSADAGRVALSDSTFPSCFLTDGSPGGLHLSEVGFIGDSITFRISYPARPILSVEPGKLDFRDVSQSSPVRDTSFRVRNLGLADDSVDVSVECFPVLPDSALTASPASFALPAGDSATVTVTLRPQLLVEFSYYSAVVHVHSRFGYGQTDYEKQVAFQLVTNVTESGGLPAVYALEQNYPNPFNPTTTIAYALPRAGPVRLEVFTVLGQALARLVDQEQSPGFYTVTWEAAGLPSGVYLCRLQAGGMVMTRKLLLMR